MFGRARRGFVALLSRSAGSRRSRTGALRLSRNTAVPSSRESNAQICPASETPREALGVEAAAARGFCAPAGPQEALKRANTLQYFDISQLC